MVWSVYGTGWWGISSLAASAVAAANPAIQMDCARIPRPEIGTGFGRVSFKCPFMN